MPVEMSVLCLSPAGSPGTGREAEEEEEEDGSVVRAPGKSSQVTAVTPVENSRRSLTGGQGKQGADQLCSQVHPNPDWLIGYLDSK